MAINMTFVDFVTPVPADWLNNVNTVVNNPATNSYTAPFTGSVTRTNVSKLSDTVSVLDFGADPTGVADSTTAMQSAHNTGRTIYYPAGTYKFSTLSINGGGGIVGDGLGQTILNSSDLTSNDLITFLGTGSTTAVPLFRDFTLQSSLTKPSGYGLHFAPSSGELDLIYVEDVTFTSLPGGIHFSADAYFKVDNCNFINYLTSAITVENTYIADSGDSFISNCFLNTGRVTGGTFGINHLSSGGLKIVNTKVLGGDYGYNMNWNATNSADLLIGNCSFENQTARGIYFARQSGSGAFGSVMVGNSEISAPICVSTDTSGFLTLVSITGNIFNIPTTSGTGLLLANASNFVVGPNVFNGQGGGSPVGISVLAACTNGKIYPQTFINIPSSALSNGSTSTYIIGTPQSGVASLTASSGYNSLFLGSVAVTFPVPYLVAPQVWCAPSGSGGGQVSVFAQNVTTTGFTMVGISATNGGVMNNNVWRAEGII